MFDAGAMVPPCSRSKPRCGCSPQFVPNDSAQAGSRRPSPTSSGWVPAERPAHHLPHDTVRAADLDDVFELICGLQEQVDKRTWNSRSSRLTSRRVSMSSSSPSAIRPDR